MSPASAPRPSELRQGDLDHLVRRAERGNPTPPEAVRSMFDRVAPLYDAMNAVMTAGIDARWRRDAIRAARLLPGMHVLDVASGTGGLARAAAMAVGPSGRVIGTDVSAGMLRLARRRRVPAGATQPAYAAADVLALPWPEGTFDAVTIGFGLRNLSDYSAALREMARVARPGARVVVLEIARPRGRIGRLLFDTWFRRVIPVLGRFAGGGEAYGYLPASVLGYPAPERIAELMAGVGLSDVQWRWLATGLATVHIGVRPPQ